MADTHGTTSQPPHASYSLTVQVQLEGITAPLAISAGSVNELRKAVRLLQANGLLAVSQSTTSTAGEPPICPTHHKPMKPSKKPGA
jgi:hypothetical protein